MGNRANINLKNDERDGIYLYTHWGGSTLPVVLQDALKKKQRWNDESYLNRIIFSQMIKDDIDGETGYGLSLDIPDNEHEIIIVNSTTQTVKIGDKEWSFEEYIEEDLTNFEY